MSIEVDDLVYFYEWTTANNQNTHTKFRATVRVVISGAGDEYDGTARKVHLIVSEGETGPAGFRNVNNVEYIEERSREDMIGISYWKFDSKAVVE